MRLVPETLSVKGSGAEFWGSAPDGFAGGFVLDRGGEGGVRLVLKQEGQRRLGRVCSETRRQMNATGFSASAPRPRPRGQPVLVFVTFRLAPVFQQVLVGYGEVAPLEPPTLAIGSLGWVQLPGRRVGGLVVPHRTERDGYGFLVSLQRMKNHTFFLLQTKPSGCESTA